MGPLKQQLERFRAEADAEVQACPFCRGGGKIKSQQIYEDGTATWGECISCGAKTDIVEDVYTDYETARSAWNTRASDEILTALEAAMQVIEQQREALEKIKMSVPKSVKICEGFYHKYTPNPVYVEADKTLENTQKVVG